VGARRIIGKSRIPNPSLMANETLQVRAVGDGPQLRDVVAAGSKQHGTAGRKLERQEVPELDVTIMQ
jgi:hypothetical protein